MEFGLLIIGSYLLGAVPFSFLIGKAHGKDLRTIGSGNIGATNLSRAVSKKWAYLGFTLDVLKGLVPTLAASFYVPNQPTTGDLFLWLAVGMAAMIGHIFPVYLKFKGGKGVATSFGVAMGLWPFYTYSAICAAAVWVVFVLIWRYISLASIAGAVTFPLALTIIIVLNQTWHFSELWPLFTIALAIPVMVIIRHIANIKRIIAGTESKVLHGKKKIPNE